MRGRWEWTGFYYDGRTAQREPVTLTLESGGLQLRLSDGTAILWPFGRMRQTQGRFPGERLRIEIGTDTVESVLVNEPGLAEEIRRASPSASPTLRGHDSAARVVAWSVGAMAIAVASYVWGAPVAAERIASRVPVAWEVTLGRSVVEELAPLERLCGDSASLAHLRTVLDRLLAAGPQPRYRFHLLVVRDSSVNAFAAPGGYIVVNSGLLRAATTPEQFAGVLAHEIQHVSLRHSTRAMIREVPLRLALATLSGAGVETAAAVVGSLGAMRYRRGDEAEADREGIRLLTAAHVDQAGMIAFMRALEPPGESAGGMPSYLSSHPRTADRVTELEALARQNGYEATPLLDADAWQSVQSMCDERSSAARSPSGVKPAPGA